MASIAKRPSGKWRARYRDPAGRERSKHFVLKRDAEAWLNDQESRIADGSWTDPNRAKVTIDSVGRQWLDRQISLKPSTLTRYRSIFNRHIVPTWGAVRLSGVDYEGVAAWVSDLSGKGLSASSVRQCYRVLSLILTDAVKAGRIPRNPAEGVDLPRTVTKEKRFLTPGEVAALADGAGDYRAVVLTLAYTGLRFGEATALRVRNVDLMRRRLSIVESMTEVAGRLTLGTPKTHQQRRVPLPRFLVDEVAPWVKGKGPDDLVFTSPLGEPLRINNFRKRVFDPALKKAGLVGVTPHDLRHTAASLAVGTGANVKDVQQMLGHASAAMTLDVYAGLFDDSLDGVADRMDALARESFADYLRTDRQILELPTGSD